MRVVPGLLVGAVVFLFGCRSALATTEACAPAASATTGERADEVLQHCGTPAASRHFAGAYGRFGYRQPEDLWVYDLGEGTFLRVLHFVGGILDTIALVSRSS